MNYFDFTDDIFGLNQPTDMIPAAIQPSTTTTTTTPSAVINQHQAQDLSDWRNNQAGTTSTLFDPFWMPQTPLSNTWNTSTNTVYPSPYNQLTASSQYPYQWTNPNNNQQWQMPTFPLGTTQSFVNFNYPDTMNNATDLATNTTVNSSTLMRFDKCFSLVI
jgi:hypothetical protein